ncbi:hypothetical protein [Leptothoe sp. PORK10 BA2]|uniref:hypothetical protein n=1 Tax=Leptothoe sp. PORK10 BA2 TaxID=3110254 RepID=UPI002B21D858|nr:hypothetical protein [Leptothoe sp. PORK10 BA2]MEA5462759.1 hypothetical protein [Leptothoe sp. PORK10 BA2]
MTFSPVPKPTVNFFTSAILLFIGSFGGTHLTAVVAPYSQFSGLVGFLMFPIAFLTGMRLWLWVDLRIEDCRSFVTKARHSQKKAPGRFRGAISSFAFVLTSVLVSMLSGLILTPPAMQVVVDPGYKMLITGGTIYGIICWALIQLGYLQYGDGYPTD